MFIKQATVPNLSIQDRLLPLLPLKSPNVFANVLLNVKKF
jgi:hypothetical protein